MDNLITFIDIYRNVMQNVEFCKKCKDIRQVGLFSCCGERSFIKYKDMTEDEQRRIAIDEYDANHE